jgi:hypothetical protein
MSFAFFVGIKPAICRTAFAADTENSYFDPRLGFDEAFV